MKPISRHARTLYSKRVFFVSQTIAGEPIYLTHPPLYEYTIALMFRLFGENEFTARGFGVFIYFLGGLLMILTLRELFRRENPLLLIVAGWSAALLYLVNPLLIQHSLLVDADTTGTTLFLAIFVFLFVRFEARHGTGEKGAFIRSRIGLAVVFALMFLFKEFTPYLVFGALTAYRFLRRQWKPWGMEVLWVLGLGSLLAWGLWTLYCLAVGINPFTFLLVHFFWRYDAPMDPEFVRGVLSRLNYIARWPVYWMSTPFWLLVLGLLFSRVSRFFRMRDLEGVDFCLIVASVVWIPYFFFKPSIDMMKYQHTIYSLLILSVTWFAVHLFKPWIQGNSKSFKVYSWGCVVALGVFALGVTYYLRLGDYITFLWDLTWKPRWVNFVTVYHAPIFTVLACVFLLCLIFKRKIILPSLVFACFLMILPINTALNFNQMTDYTTAESYLNYGETGLKTTVNYLANNLRSGDVASIRKDIHYYLRVKHGIKLAHVTKVRKILLTEHPEILKGILVDSSLMYIVLEQHSLVGLPASRMQRALAMLNKHYYLEEKYGFFSIYKRRP